VLLFPNYIYGIFERVFTISYALVHYFKVWI